MIAQVARVITERRGRTAAEALTIVALVGLGIWYGRFAFEHSTLRPDYHYLAPAVMVAAGHGFQNPEPVAGSPLDQFLSGRVQRIAREEVIPARMEPPNQFHHSARYLIFAVGFWWKLAGISWDEVAGVAAALHGVAVLGTYALLRLLVPWAVAVAGALWMCTSTLQLAFVPHVRDYSKGAFIIAALPLVVAMAIGCRSRRRLLAAAGVTGGVIGLGLGFKMDVAVMAPIAIGAIVCFRGRRPWTGLGEKARAAGVFTLVLALAASPILLNLSSGGSNAVHVALLGYADGFDANLGIVPSMYSVLPFYSDAYVAQVVNAHHAPQSGPLLAFPSRDYDEAGMAVWLDVVRHFPADVVARALAATNSALNLVFVKPDPSFLNRPLPLQDGFVRFYTWLHRWNGWGGALGMLLVAVAAWRRPRHGVLAAGLLLLLGGYPSLQFESRHYFHTQVIPVAAILLVLSATWGALRSWVPPLGQPPSLDRARVVAGVLRVSAAAAILLLVTAGPLAAARFYQSNHLESVLSRHLRAVRASVPVAWVEEPNGSWFAQFPVRAPSVPGEQRPAHYLIELHGDDPATLVVVGLRYASASMEDDYSRTVVLRPLPGINRIAFSTFDVLERSRFDGIELGEEGRRRLAGIYRIEAGGPAGLPLDVALPSDWAHRRLYQRLRLEGEERTATNGPYIFCSSRPGCRGLIGLLERAEGRAMTAGSLGARITHAPSVLVTPEGIVMDGVAESESSYLLEWYPIDVERRGALVLNGRLDEGGFSVGLLEQGRWHSQVGIRTPGDFVAVLPVDAGGSYVPLLTNSMPPGRRRSRFAITSVHFVEDGALAVEER